MRGIAGILFIGLGFIVAYLILSGKFPSSTPLVSPHSNVASSLPTGNNAQKQGAIIANKNIGSGPTGLPTMGHFHDLVASQGGLS